MAKNTLTGDTLVIFRIDDKLFGLHLEQVARVERAVKVTSVPEAPPDLMGVIDNHGSIVPVIDMRYRMGLPQRPLNINDQMIVLRCHFYTIIVPVDKVEGVAKANNIITPTRLIGKEMNIPQLMSTHMGIVMVLSGEQILSFNDTLALQEVIDHIPIDSRPLVDISLTDAKPANL